MNWVGAILGLLRLAGFIMSRISMNEGAKQQIALELAEMNKRISVTKKIVDEKVSDAQVDDDLRR